LSIEYEPRYLSNFRKCMPYDDLSISVKIVLSFTYSQFRNSFSQTFRGSLFDIVPTVEPTRRFLQPLRAQLFFLRPLEWRHRERLVQLGPLLAEACIVLVPQELRRCLCSKCGRVRNREDVRIFYTNFRRIFYKNFAVKT
jgi:hypothetical protein